MTERGWGKRGSCIVLVHRKVGNMGNLGRTMGYIHRATLVKSTTVQNMGGFTYEKVDRRVTLHITLLTKGKEE